LLYTIDALAVLVVGTTLAVCGRTLPVGLAVLRVGQSPGKHAHGTAYDVADVVALGVAEGLGACLCLVPRDADAWQGPGFVEDGPLQALVGVGKL